MTTSAEKLKEERTKADKKASNCSKLVQHFRAKDVVMIRNLEQIFISQNDAAVLHDILSIQRELRGLLTASLVMSAFNGDQLPNQNIIFMYLRLDTDVRICGSHQCYVMVKAHN